MRRYILSAEDAAYLPEQHTLHASKPGVGAANTAAIVLGAAALLAFGMHVMPALKRRKK